MASLSDGLPSPWLYLVSEAGVALLLRCGGKDPLVAKTDDMAGEAVDGKLSEKPVFSIIDDKSDCCPLEANAKRVLGDGSCRRPVHRRAFRDNRPCRVVVLSLEGAVGRQDGEAVVSEVMSVSEPVSVFEERERS